MVLREKGPCLVTMVTFKKLKPAEGISDLVDLMKAQFTSFRADFQDMRNEMSSTLESKFTSFESKLTGTVMKVVHEEIDSVKKDFNSRMDGLSSKLGAKMVKFVETHIEQKLSLSSEDVKSKLGISELQNEVASLKMSYADVASSGASASVSLARDGIELNVIASRALGAIYSKFLCAGSMNILFILNW